MLALRYGAVLALMIWIGGLLVLGAFAAPAAFDVLGARGADGRTLAGAVFAETLRRFHVAAYVCGGVVVSSLATRAVLGPRPRWFALRMIVSIAITGIALWTGLVLTPQITATQRSLGVSPSTLPETDPRRIEFGRLHGLSISLELMTVLGGLALIFFELKD
jgi:Domain of unknown function (DUF4149)